MKINTTPPNLPLSGEETSPLTPLQNFNSGEGKSV